VLYFGRLGMRRFWSWPEWVRSLRGSGGGAALNHRLIECDPSRVKTKAAKGGNHPVNSDLISLAVPGIAFAQAVDFSRLPGCRSGFRV
jgi:hypothetical protein